MKRFHIKIVLWLAIICLSYLVYSSIKDEMNFESDSKLRLAENIQKLKDLRKLQMEYEKFYDFYANDFASLISFYNNDSVPIVKMIWDEKKHEEYIKNEEAEDLTDEQAIKLGILTKDTTLVLAKDIVYDDQYLKTRNQKYPLLIEKLSMIPFTDKEYNIQSGSINKGNVIVQVFQISASYRDIFNNLPIENRKGLDKLLKVGSMTEASLNGNWGE